jgi:hypothetical protein
MAVNTGNPIFFANTNIPIAIQSNLGTYLHVLGGQANNQAKISTWQWVDQPNLKWYIESVPGTGHFFLSSAINRNFVVHQLGANTNNGGELTLWDKNTHGHQGNLQVVFEPSHDGSWFIKFVHSGKYIHVQGALTTNNCPVTQWERVEQNNLKWRFHPAGAQISSPGNWALFGHKPTLAIQSGVGSYLHVLNGVANNEAKLTTWNWVNQDNLKWHIEPSPNPGFFFISSKINPSFVVHQLGANNNNGGETTLWNKATHGHQGNLQVSFEPAGGEFWYIKFAHSGKYLHVQGGRPDNNQPVTQWDRVDQANLKWRFLHVE